ncbi:MAG: hypothetical protein ACRCWW_01170 [Scandinavium sp.]|uniref:hypothetical protein n=1 Tax=Scandinavium sp. TaxID=2830653 RepID=UPI003F41262A
MTAKAQFLKKLQEQKSRTGAEGSQADITEFRQRIGELQENMEAWLAGTGIGIESTAVSLIEYLIGGKVFNVSGILLRYENKTVAFTPVFLYGQGVTGCMEVTFCEGGKNTPACRLFMRSSESARWTWSPTGPGWTPRCEFNEDVFFDMMSRLLA